MDELPTVADLTHLVFGHIPDLPPLSEAERVAAEAREAAENARTAGLAWWQASVPPRFAHARTDHTDVLAWAGSVIADLRAAPSLLLVGPVGAGKTHQAYGALYLLATSGRTIGWRAIKAGNFLADLRPGSGHDAEALMRRLTLGTAVLLLDDVGAGKDSEWTEEMLLRLVDTRYEACLPTIITTNLTPNEMPERLGERLASRLVGMSTLVVLEGNDRRYGDA